MLQPCQSRLAQAELFLSGQARTTSHQFIDKKENNPGPIIRVIHQEALTELPFSWQPFAGAGPPIAVRCVWDQIDRVIQGFVRRPVGSLIEQILRLL